MVFLPGVSLVAVLIAAVASMVLGMLWYSPALFGKKWMKLMKFSPQKMKAMKSKDQHAMIGGFVIALVTAYVLAYFVSLAGAATLMAGAMIGFLAWLGFAATIMAGSVLWEGKSINLYYLNAAYWLVSLTMQGAILAVWA